MQVFNRNSSSKSASCKYLHIIFSFLFPTLLSAVSISELSEYPLLCKEASNNPDVFKSFKRNPKYQPILEHLSFDQGKDYLALIEDKYPFLLSRFEKFKENDFIGDPFQYDYGCKYGMLSPGTLRYIKVAGDLLSLFGDLSQKKIVEIGVGYGGQCKIISDVGNFSSYTLIDLPETCGLAKKYLETLNVKNVELIHRNEIPDEREYDLLISNYAFSEINKEEQLIYIEKVLNKSKSGYMICNFISDIFGIDSFAIDELIDLLKMPNRKIRLIAEEPLTHLKNIVIVWSQTDC